MDDVHVGLARGVAVAQLVALAQLKLARQARGDLAVGHAVADAGLDLVQCLPLHLWEGQA